jgi:hypothetical protein
MPLEALLVLENHKPSFDIPSEKLILSAISYDEPQVSFDMAYVRYRDDSI